MLKQTEEDADKEILELKTKYEKILRSERHSDPKSIIPFGNSAFLRVFFEIFSTTNLRIYGRKTENDFSKMSHI